MKPINKTALQTLSHLYATAKQNGGHVKIDNTKGFMPVVVEILGEVKTNIAKRPFIQVSVAHYFEQNGDLVVDPEMIFWLYPSETGAILAAYPVSIQHSFGATVRGMDIDAQGRVLIVKSQQSGQATFAGTWMRNIKSQQRLKTAAPATA